MENRRQHYRISYPDFERPRFIHGTAISEVLECSERGLRFIPSDEMPAVGSHVAGRVVMCHGVQLGVAGTVVWSEADTVALHLDTTPIPFLGIIREQLYLRRAARQRDEARRAAEARDPQGESGVG